MKLKNSYKTQLMKKAKKQKSCLLKSNPQNKKMRPFATKLKDNCPSETAPTWLFLKFLPCKINQTFSQNSNLITTTVLPKSKL